MLGVCLVGQSTDWLGKPKYFTKVFVASLRITFTHLVHHLTCASALLCSARLQLVLLLLLLLHACFCHHTAAAMFMSFTACYYMLFSGLR